MGDEAGGLWVRIHLNGRVGIIKASPEHLEAGSYQWVVMQDMGELKDRGLANGLATAQTDADVTSDCPPPCACDPWRFVEPS